MNETIILRMGKKLQDAIFQSVTRYGFKEKINTVRKNFLQEFQSMPPNIRIMIFEKDVSLSEYAYGFEMKGFGSLYYDLSDWQQYTEDKSEMTSKVLFHLSRFIRKWYMDAPDIMIEKKYEYLPFVVEYGKELVDTVETDDFLEKIKELTGTSVCFWESEYVAENELVIYVYGTDYYVSKPFSEPEKILSEIIQPIVNENRNILKSMSK